MDMSWNGYKRGVGYLSYLNVDWKKPQIDGNHVYTAMQNRVPAFAKEQRCRGTNLVMNWVTSSAVCGHVLFGTS